MSIGFSMGHIPPSAPVAQGGQQLISTTAVKGQWRRTVRVIQGAGLTGWYARIETGKLGYPDELTHAADGPAFSSNAEASLTAGRIMGGWLKDGWTFCDNFDTEHSHERMQAARFRLSPQVKNRKGRPLFTTIEYPEPYHLASYIKVTTDTGEPQPGGVKQFSYDYKTAFEANAAAKRRIDEAVQQGYQLMAQSAAATGANVAASAGVKLALSPPIEDDFSGLIKSFDRDTHTNLATVIAEVQSHLHLDKRLLKRAAEYQPFPVPGGLFFPTHTHQEVVLNKFNSTTYRLTINGEFVAGGKAVGGPGTMPAMGVKKSFAEINAKPPEPPKLRHIEFED